MPFGRGTINKERYEANLEILRVLNGLVHRYPNMRFNQILSSLGVKEILFYEESKVTLAAIKAGIENLPPQG